MYRVLLINEDKNLQKLIALNLRAYVGAESILSSGINDAYTLLASQESFDVIICDENISEKKVAQELFHYLSSNEIIVPLIVIGKILEDSSLVINIPSGQWKEVIRVTARTLEVTSSQMIEDHKGLDDFYPFKIQYLLDIDVDQCATDVYVTNKESFDIYIEKGEPFPSIILEELVKNEEKYVFVKKSQRLNFVNQFSENLLAKLTDKSLPTDDKMKIGEICFDTIRDQIHLIGMQGHTVELAQAQVQSMAELISCDDPLFDFIKRLKSNTDSFLYQHSILTALICTQITTKIEWASQEHIQKICFISLFHDVVLEDDTQARISSNRELEESKIEMSKKKVVLTHALQASNLVKANPNCPFGADNIILQHHGQNNGIGFHDGLNSSVSQLTIIFMIAEDYAETILDIDPEFFNKENVMELMKSKYNKGMYKKIMNILEEI